MRKAEVNRSTGETQVQLYLDLDGSGWSEIDTGIGFMDHMLVLLAKHAGFDLKVKCQGDVYVDDHHSVEDIGISLGLAFAKALGDKQGICRYGDTTLAMDEALILTSLDISGRSYLDYRMEIPTEKVGTFDTELAEEFVMGFVRNAGVTLHIRQLAGTNSHHIIEGMFKSLAHTLRKAVAVDERFRNEIPSTKGRIPPSCRFSRRAADTWESPLCVTSDTVYKSVLTGGLGQIHEADGLDLNGQAALAGNLRTARVQFGFRQGKPQFLAVGSAHGHGHGHGGRHVRELLVFVMLHKTSG